MVRIFEKVEIERERDLEEIAKKHPDQIEDGLVYLEHQLHLGRGFLDVLFADAKRTLVAAELKVNNDEGILTQALKYFDSVERDRDRLAHHFANRAKIDEDQEPRILLLAPSFSEEVRKAARHIKPKTTLLEFEYLRTKAGEEGLRCRAVALEPESYFRPPVKVEKIISYIYLPKLRDTCNEVIQAIQGIGDDLDQPKGIGETEIRFRYRNHWLANIYTKHKFFHIRYGPAKDKYVKIREPRDWQRGRDSVLRTIGKTYESLGGIPKR